MKWSIRGLVLLGLLGAGALAPAWAQVVPGVYTCIDAKGRKLTADRPIPECTDREQKVLNPSGTVKLRIGPTLTDHERVALEKQARKEEEERGRVAEDKRRDRALLTRYPNKPAHDKERTEALNGISAVTQAANLRLTELVRQKVGIDAEMEFYQDDPTKAPAYVRRQLEENLQSQAVQKRFIGEQEGETRRVNQRFDEELVRLRQLWTQVTPASSR
jgi:hypothetical protein